MQEVRIKTGKGSCCGTAEELQMAVQWDCSGTAVEPVMEVPRAAHLCHGAHGLQKFASELNLKRGRKVNPLRRVRILRDFFKSDERHGIICSGGGCGCGVTRVG